MQTINLLPGEREPTPDELQSGAVVVVEYVKWIGQELFRVVLRPGQCADGVAAIRAKWEGQRFTGPAGAFTFNDVDTPVLIGQVEEACVMPDVTFTVPAAP
ncbi:MAG TPA: hypothetical protein PKV72_00120 [Candidatus Peribacteria bacterium]|nr:hypothetical protein [Candidatus Peribacteria bacterium]